MTIRTTVSIILTLFISVNTFAQHSKDTSFVQASIQSAEDIYKKSIENQSHRYNGKEYIHLKTTRKEIGHLYFLEDDWYDGSIEYSNENYTNVSMRYDVLRQKIVIEFGEGIDEIELINEKINQFAMAGHTFKNIRAEDNSTIKAGYYDILYAGKTQVLAYRQKIIQEQTESGELVMKFLIKDKIFVYKNAIYYQITNKSSLIKVLGDHKQEIKKYISKMKINYRDNREAAVKEITGYYDQL